MFDPIPCWHTVCSWWQVQVTPIFFESLFTIVYLNDKPLLHINIIFLCEIYIITVYISPFNRNVITDTKVLQCDSTIIVLQRDSALWYRRLAEVTETSKFLGIAATATIVTPSSGYNGTSASESGKFKCAIPTCYKRRRGGQAVRERGINVIVCGFASRCGRG